MSITGAIGGCCLAYIGPGLAYLGVHGDAFLEWIAGCTVDRKQRSSPLTVGRTGRIPTTAVDLPVEGDATLNAQTTSTMESPRLRLAEATSSKPWWWWPTLMPLWVAVATHGSAGMDDRLAPWERHHHNDADHDGRPAEEWDENGSSSRSSNSHHPSASAAGTSAEIIPPCKRDYLFSIFFITFGVVAMVAGVLSNIYVQVHGIFYTPT